MALKMQHQWGAALCAAALVWIAIYESEDTDSLPIEGTARMEKRVAHNQLFELDESCNKSCTDHIMGRLEDALGCVNPTYRRYTHMIEGSCSSMDSLTPFQVGALAEARLKGIKNHYNDTIVHVPQDENPRTVGPDDHLPLGDRWLTREPAAKFDGGGIVAVSRERQHIDYANWGLDRIDQYAGWTSEPGQPSLDGIFDDKCFPRQGRGATVCICRSPRRPPRRTAGHVSTTASLVLHL
jgi:hypothetical protein